MVLLLLLEYERRQHSIFPFKFVRSRAVHVACTLLVPVCVDSRTPKSAPASHASTDASLAFFPSSNINNPFEWTQHSRTPKGQKCLTQLRCRTTGPWSNAMTRWRNA